MGTKFSTKVLNHLASHGALGISPVELPRAPTPVLSLLRDPSESPVDLPKKVRKGTTALLRPLFERAGEEPDLNLDGVRPNHWTKSLLSGTSALYVVDDHSRAIGHVRLKPRFSEDTKRALGIRTRYEILEMGSLMVDDEYRSSGVSTSLMQQLLSANLERMQQGELLVIATMKSATTMLAFKRAFRGFDDSGFFNHLDFRMIAPLTCRCTPDLGYGFQIAPATVCSERVSNSAALSAINSTGPEEFVLPHILETLNGSCVLFVSDARLARTIDDEMASRLKISLSDAVEAGYAGGITDRTAIRTDVVVRRLDRSGYYDH